MEANKILTADFLDLLFEGRNKSYGAFDLRKNYNRRLLAACGITILCIALVIAGYVSAGYARRGEERTGIMGDIKQVNIPPAEPPKIILLHPKTAVSKTAERKFATIKITSEKFDENDKPPVSDALVESRISLINKTGFQDDHITAPPGNVIDKGIVTIVPPVDAADSVFIGVEIESSYPGGTSAWLRFLNKTFSYPQAAIESVTQGTVVVKFIVDRAGNVSNVQAESGPSTGGLKEEAERVIRKSGRWEPAVQNGRKVSSYKSQPISFRLE